MRRQSLRKDGVVALREDTSKTRHTASTSMYSLTFRVCVTTPPLYGRNGMAHAVGALILSPARGVFAGMRSVCVCVCGMRAVGPADYRWALPRISIVLHSNATRAPTANPPNSAQLGASPTTPQVTSGFMQ